MVDRRLCHARATAAIDNITTPNASAPVWTSATTAVKSCDISSEESIMRSPAMKGATHTKQEKSSEQRNRQLRTFPVAKSALRCQRFWTRRPLKFTKSMI
jgi:hypothetical protein